LHENNVLILITYAMKLIKIIVLLSLIWLASCKSSTQQFSPDFNDKKANVLANIESEFRFHGIKIEGSKSMCDGKIRSCLTVKFMNGKDLPTNEHTLDVETKQLASNIKSILKDPKDIYKYHIRLVTETVYNNKPNENFVGEDITSNELK